MEVGMLANNSVLCLVPLLLFSVLYAGCARHLNPATPMKSAVRLEQSVGSEVEVEGIPVGSKGNHAILTASGRIEIDRAWPETVFDDLTGAYRKVRVQGLLVREKAMTWHDAAK